MLMLGLGIGIVSILGVRPAVGGPYDFSFTASFPGATGEIPDEGIKIFPLFITPRVESIQFMEGVIWGLSHESPADLDLYLVAPFDGVFIELMSDRGGTFPVTHVTLTFSDFGASLPGAPLGTGTYRPEGQANETDLGFGRFVGGGSGNGAWLLLAIDDAAADSGRIDSFTLRGRVSNQSSLTLFPMFSGNRGACCFSPSICFENAEVDACGLAGGVFLGDGLTCAGDPDGDGAIGCNDGCPLDPAKTHSGFCGCGVPDLDLDDDGVADCIDRCLDTPPYTPVDSVGCTALGACCFRVGACFDGVDHASCKTVGGVYQGHRSRCGLGCEYADDGDIDGDRDTDRCDLYYWVGCRTGPDLRFAPSGCERADIDEDGDIDLADFARFQRVFVPGFPCPYYPPQSVRVKSSGVAQPGEMVVLSLDEDLPAACDAATLWTQTAGTAALNPNDSHADGSFTFTAPNVAVTMNLSFRVDIPANCAPNQPARTANLTVPVHVANVVFDLPATIALNSPLSLVSFTSVSGAPADFLTLYFSEEPLPAGVNLEINQFDRTLTVTSGVGQTIEITVQVFAASGLLAQGADTIQIIAAGP
jgi:hypothetical protein